MQIMRKIFVTVLAFMVLTPPSPSKALDFDRVVIDDDFAGVDQVEMADVNGDGEVFAGGRGSGKGVVMYDPAGSTWVRTVVDASLSANDLRSGDLDKDGAVDIVGVGGESRNVIWYKARARSAPRR